MKCAVFSGEAQVMLVSKAFSRPPPLERLMRLLSKVLKFNLTFTSALEIPHANSCQPFCALKNYMFGLSPLIKQVSCTWLDSLSRSGNNGRPYEYFV